MNKRKTVCILFAASAVLSGCRADSVSSDTETAEHTETEAAAETADTAPAETQTETTAEPEQKPYEFNPHVYSPKMSAVIPQEKWDALYCLCDALRAGEDTFSCASEEAYKWATDPCILSQLFPAACITVTGVSNDGTVPFENGIGRIYYQIPVEEYVKRQADFEESVVDVLNTYLEPDDNEYEKCLKLYDYMESNYDYENVPETLDCGASYYTFIHRKGVCDELSAVFTYFLMQVGVDALAVGCFDPDMCHSWTYVTISGQGYHIDPTWSLKSQSGTDELDLEYFMMTDEHRINDGCTLDDLTVDLLPEFWVNFSTLRFPADDDRYSIPYHAVLNSIDEEKKIVYYTDMYGVSSELHYG